MARVVCQVLVHPQRVTFRWSESGAHFEPYVLENDSLQRFWNAVENANQRLLQLALHQTRDDRPQAEAAFALAEAGHRLFQSIFPPSDLSAEIRQWLGRQLQAGSIDSIEITGDTIGRVPWNIVYDDEPNEASFAEPRGDCWKPFWGIRYPLTTSHRYNPLRSVGALDAPEILLAIDPDVQQAAPDQTQQRLARFAEARNCPFIETVQGLAAAVAESVPDILYLEGRFEEGEFWLGDEALTSAALTPHLRDSNGAQIPWNNLLVIVIAAAADDDGDWSTLREGFLKLHFGGLVICDHPLAPEVAHQFGAELLERFIDRGDTIATAVQTTRVGLGSSGLLFSVACPPHLQTTWQSGDNEQDDNLEEEDADRPAPLPEDPYRPLIPCTVENRALLVGRDDDVAACAELIDTPTTALMILHGRSGVGKSSILRAGLTPLLDEDTPGFLLLRDRSGEGDKEDETTKSPILVLRAANDLAGQLAPALCAFAATPFTFTTPTKRDVSIDLEAKLRGQFDDDSENGEVPPERLRAALLRDEDLLGRLLASFGKFLPCDILLTIEQGEELFTLSKTAEDVKLRKQAISILAGVANQPGHAKVIVSLRTEFAARFASRLRASLANDAALADYLLPALNVDQLTRVIRQPALNEPIHYSTEIPFEKYRFDFEPALPRHIALEAVRAANEGGDEALPVVQAVCYLLYLQLEGRDDRTIAEQDLKTIGGIQGAVRAYTERILAAVGSLGDRKRLVAFLRGMVRRQPDGLLARDLIAERELIDSWKGRRPLRDLVDHAAADDVQLLQETFLFTDQGKTSRYGLGHDAYLGPLTAISRDLQQKAHGRSRMLDTLFVVVPAVVLLGVILFVFQVRPAFTQRDENKARFDEAVKALKDQEKDFKKRLAEEQWASYGAQMQQAYAAWKTGDLRRLREHLVRTLPGNVPYEFRGFEWFHLLHLAQTERRRMAEHKGEVVALAVSPDGKTLASAGWDGVINLWNPKEGKLFSTLKSESGKIHSVAFDPDGTWLACGAEDGAVSLWRIKTEKGKDAPLFEKNGELKGHKGAVRTVVFARIGSSPVSLVTAGADRSVRVWDVAKGKELQLLKGHADAINALAVSPKGDLFASADDTGKIIFWNADTKKKVGDCRHGNAPVFDLAISPDGKTLAAAGARQQGSSEFGVVRFWDANDRKEKATALQTGTAVLTVAFTPDGRSVFTGGKDNHIRRWDTASGKATTKQTAHLDWVRALVFMPDGKSFLSASNDRLVKLWETEPAPRVLSVAKDSLTCLAVSPDGDSIAAGANDGSVKIWNANNGKLTQTLQPKMDAITSIAFAKRDKELLLAVGGKANGANAQLLSIWNAGSGKKIEDFKSSASGVAALAFSPDGETLIAAGIDGSLEVWNALKKKKRLTLTGHKGPLSALAFSPEKSLVAGATEEGIVHIWDALSGKELTAGKPMTEHTGPVYALAFNEGGEFLASAGADRFIRFWDVKKLEKISDFYGHTQPVHHLAFNPFRPTLSSAGRDGTVRLWFWPVVLPENRKQVKWSDQGPFVLTDHIGPVRGLAFASERQLLVSAGKDGTIRIYRTGSPK